MEKIIDFGEKIGGARKDTWSARGLRLEDIVEMNEEEKKKYVTKDNIWPLPDAKKQVEEEGMDRFVAYFIRRMRRVANAKPLARWDADFNQTIEDYIASMVAYKTRIERIKTLDDIDEFFKDCIDSEKNWWAIPQEWQYAVKSKWIRNMRLNLKYYAEKCVAENFPYGKGKQSRPRKKAFIPPQLTHIVRGGKDFLNGYNATPDKWQNTFHLRGVEFGNWNSQNDRQQNLNMCFLALKDLAVILGISDADVSFDGSLALGFGSRGVKGACAHYEPMRRVINLTKMRGAGSLGHEWGHALDHYIAQVFCGYTDKFASDLRFEYREDIPQTFIDLVVSLKQQGGHETEFYANSKAFDKAFSKDSHGYWASTIEMFARAFACYLVDRCEYRTDYLCGHADAYLSVDLNTGKPIYAVPMGEERHLINQNFDNLFKELIQKGIFTPRPVEIVEMKEKTVWALQPKEGSANSMQFGFELYEGENGQLSLVV